MATRTTRSNPSSEQNAPKSGGDRASLKDRGVVRLTADVPVADANLLARVAELTGYNKVTTIVRAIRVLASLEEAERKGGEVTITYPDKTRERLLVR